MSHRNESCHTGMSHVTHEFVACHTQLIKVVIIKFSPTVTGPVFKTKKKQILNMFGAYLFYVQYETVLQCVVVHCSVLQCVAVCCSVLQCVAVCCSMFESIWGVSVLCAVRMRVAVRCSAL